MYVQSGGPWSLGNRTTWREPRYQAFLSVREPKVEEEDDTATVTTTPDKQESSISIEESKHPHPKVTFVIMLHIVPPPLRKLLVRRVKAPVCMLLRYLNVRSASVVEYFMVNDNMHSGIPITALIVLIISFRPDYHAHISNIYPRMETKRTC